MARLRRPRQFFLWTALLGLSALAATAKPSKEQKDYYDTLGISSSASEAEIKRAYRKLAVKWHPDKNPDQQEVAQKEFIAVQQAYEVLSDPEKRRRYDNQKAFFSEGDGEQWDGADNSGGFEPPGAPVSSLEQLMKLMSGGVPVVIHVYSNQRHFFGGWMHEFAAHVKLAHLNVFTAEEAALQKVRIRRYPMFIICSGFGDFNYFHPHGWDFLNLADSVQQAVLEVVPYEEQVELLHTEADVDDFLQLHAAGSSKPRVLIFVDDVRRRYLQAFAAAGQLSGSHHFAQVAAHRWVVSRFKVRRVPSYMVIDPATRQGANSQPDLLYTGEGVGHFVSQIRATSKRILPELHQLSFDDFCGGSWSSSKCVLVALMLLPSASLGQDEAARRALRNFREACRLVQERTKGLECFWLRHDRGNGAKWRERLDSLINAENGVKPQEAGGVWVAALDGKHAEAALFPKQVLGRELAHRDLTQWLQRLQASSHIIDFILQSEGNPSARLQDLPDLPEQVQELKGPPGLIGLLLKSSQRYLGLLSEVLNELSGNSMQLLALGIMFGLPLLNNYFQGPEQSQEEQPQRENGQPENAGFKEGDVVEVSGLETHKEFNGLQGRIVGRMPPHPGEQPKLRVELRIGEETRVLAIRPKNLQSAAR